MSAIYGIPANGDLMWYRHDGWSDGTAKRASGTGTKVGSGWTFPKVFAG